MQKIINDPKDFVDEMLQGILAAHPEHLKSVSGDLRCIVRSDDIKDGKVTISTGGGSGHLPVFLGYVGKGMIDGCAVGGVFASPSSEQMLNVTKAIDKGAGVLYLYGNYSGDIINFDMAAELAEMDGIKVETVIAADDVASSPRGQESKRRGVAGIFYMYKIAGAAAEMMADLSEVKRIAEKVRDNTRTMGVGLSPCIIPEVGKPTFEMEEGEMEIGIGIHGEAGMGKSKLESADKITESITEAIIGDLPFSSGDEVSVLVNGLGATPKEELYVAYRKVDEILKNKGIMIYKPYIGEFATSLEMAGLSITMLKLDDELKEYLKAPAKTPFFEQQELM
jgi:dihydroxyacetone kinase-like protein